MANSFPSSFTLRPTFMKDEEVLISANIAGKKHVYTKNDIDTALADSGLQAAREVYKSSRSAYSFHELGAPGVRVHCIYGTSDDTIDSIHFGNGFNKPATSYGYEEGDGVAPKRSLSLCAEWSATDGSDAVHIHAFP